MEDRWMLVTTILRMSSWEISLLVLVLYTLEPTTPWTLSIPTCQKTKISLGSNLESFASIQITLVQRIPETTPKNHSDAPETISTPKISESHLLPTTTIQDAAPGTKSNTN